jgi:hypothetical protein
MARTLRQIPFADLEWTTSAALWGGTGLEVEAIPVAVLSWDTETDESTLLIRLPAGWGTPAPERHSVLQEEVLLEGDFTLGGERFTAPAFFSFPAGEVHGPAHTESGALLLVTLSGPFDIEYPAEPA